MGKINSITAYDGAQNKMRRLGLEALVEEVIDLDKSTSILLEERRREGSSSFNGAAGIRELLDNTFSKNRHMGVETIETSTGPSARS